MSLVNLAHVCSHLQNASLARLSLTSIPFTKLHLSLALILQKQGFISQVNLGGPSPPASCFGNGPADNHHVSNHPHRAAGRDPWSPEAALAMLVREGRTAQWLRAKGFNDEAVEFAMEHGHHTLEELESGGWGLHTARYIRSIRQEIDQRIHQQDETADPAWEQMAVEQKRDSAEATVLAEQPPALQTVYTQHRDMTDSELDAATFSYETLSALAGPRAIRTESHIARHGITISAMGLQIHNQPISLAKKQYYDPGHLEDESIVTQQNRASRRLWLGLKYYESKPVISKARLVSKPTKRVWLNSQELGKIVRGKQAGEVKGMTQIGEIMAISTDKGLMEARECVERRIGGQALCRVW